MSSAQSSHLLVKTIVDKAMAPAICVFGIIGNLLNLVVLTRKRLQCSMDRMEKSAHVGLVALAVSDMMYCVFHLCTLFVPRKLVSLTHFLLASTR